MKNSNMVHIDKPIRSRSYHHWTIPELEALDSKPEGVCWKVWLSQIGVFGKVRYKTAIHRWMRYRKEKDADAEKTPHLTPETAKN